MTVKVQDVAAYILRATGRLEAMKLQKLVFYSQAHSLARHDRPLFSDPIQAWRNGPVAPALYAYHRQQYWVVGAEVPGNPDALSADDTAVVTSVLARFRKYSAKQLSDMTHSESPWLKAREGYADDENSEVEISQLSMRDFYREMEYATHPKIMTAPETTATDLSTILALGTRSQMSPSAILDSVARQVASSQRLEGVEVTASDVRQILHGRYGT